MQIKPIFKWKVLHKASLWKRGTKQFGNGLFRQNLFDLNFSNSLIIHKEKTKEITTVTLVWIPDLNKHKILRTFASNFSKNYVWFEKQYQKLEKGFHQVPKHLEIGLKNSAAPRFFNTLLGVWIYPDETFFLVFDILLATSISLRNLQTYGLLFLCFCFENGGIITRTRYNIKISRVTQLILTLLWGQNNVLSTQIKIFQTLWSCDWWRHVLANS